MNKKTYKKLIAERSKVMRNFFKQYQETAKQMRINGWYIPGDKKPPLKYACRRAVVSRVRY